MPQSSPTPPYVAPSILAANFAQLRQEMEETIAGGARYFHLDVMDGHFVNNLTLGVPVVESLKPYFDEDIIFDTHLMIDNPEEFIEAFGAASVQSPHDEGRHFLSIHIERTNHVFRALDRIRAAKMRPGIVLCPATPLSAIDEILPYVDLVLLMSVDPGFGGQPFIEPVYDKIYRLRTMVKERGLDVLIEVDGGVKAHNIAQVTACGADVLVAGSAIFGQRKNGLTPEQATRDLYKAIDGIDPYQPVDPATAQNRYGARA